jgi:hypothetical protein
MEQNVAFTSKLTKLTNCQNAKMSNSALFCARVLGRNWIILRKKRVYLGDTEIQIVSKHGGTETQRYFLRQYATKLIISLLPFRD